MLIGAANENIEIFSSSGKKISNHFYAVTMIGKDKLEVSCANLIDGLYLVKYIDGEGILRFKKFIKTK